MNALALDEVLRIGLVGSGFVARFHLHAFLAVRHAAITGVASPTPAHREALARSADAMESVPAAPSTRWRQC